MDTIERFIEAQNVSYNIALNEIKNGKKRSHWMWYIFPQIKGLGQSYTSMYYGINDIKEATDYLEDEILGTRLREISNELLNLKENNPRFIFGEMDSLKLKSSMTLFDYISNDDIFDKVLNKYFNGNRDELTLNIINDMENKHIKTKEL